MTIEDRCIAILTRMLNREPTEQEIGNVATDLHILSQAIIEQQAEIVATQSTQQALLDETSAMRAL